MTPFMQERAAVMKDYDHIGLVTFSLLMLLVCCCVCVFFFFFQAEDGIRDYKVTGVQTCALPISAVWLVENTALSFDQIADFCKLHPLEVKAIADGDAAQGIKGLDPILTGQLTREQISNAAADHDLHLHISDPKVRLPEAKKKKGPRYTPVSRRQDRPNTTLWLG